MIFFRKHRCFGGLLALVLLLLVSGTFASDCRLPWPFPCSGSSQHGDGARRLITPAVYKEIESIRTSGGIKGLAISATLLAQDETVLESDSWGIKSESGQLMTPETRFYLASVSKAFLAASMGILMEDFANGKNRTTLPASFETVLDFNWQTKLKDLLPDEWALMDDWAYEKASLRDALSHVSGLPRS